MAITVDRALELSQLSGHLPLSWPAPIATEVATQQPLRSSLRWLTVAGVLVAYIGQSLLGEPGWLGQTREFHSGWLLLLTGALLVAAGWRRTQPAERVQPAVLQRSARAARLCFAASIAIYVIEIADWLLNGETARTLAAWCGGVVLLAASLVFDRRKGAAQTSDERRLRWAGVAGLFLITMVGAALRLFDLARVPLDVHGDFASVGIAARDLTAGNVAAVFSTGWAHMPWPAFGASALGMTLFGDNLFGLRMAGVLQGLVTIIGTYCLAEEILGRRIALVAASVSAVGCVDIHFSRVGAYIDPVPWLVFGFWLLLRGVRRGSLAAFGASGMLLASAFEMYYSGRLAAVMLVCVAGYLALMSRRLLVEQWRGWLLFVLAGIIVSGPLPLYHLQHWDSFVTRSREVFVFNPDNLAHLHGKYGTTTAPAVFGEQLWRSLLTFSYTHDSSTQFGFRHPFLNPFLAPLLLIGLFCSAARFRELGHALLAMWLVIGVIVGSALTVDAPAWPRLVILLPAVAALTAFGLVIAIKTTAALLAREPIDEWPTAILGIALLVPVAVQNLNWYFERARSVAAPIALVGRAVGDAPPGTSFCMVRGTLSLDDRVPQFLGNGRDMRDVHADRAALIVPRCIAENRIWIVVRPDDDAVFRFVGEKWPGGMERLIVDRDEPPRILFWTRPLNGPADIERKLPIP